MKMEIQVAITCSNYLAYASKIFCRSSKLSIKNMSMYSLPLLGRLGKEGRLLKCSDPKSHTYDRFHLKKTFL